LPCLLCKAGYYSHSREVQAHHLLKPYDGVRGMSLKANDRNVIPLCLHHHSQLHTKFGDEYQFFASYGLPTSFGKDWAKKLWEEKTSLDEQEDNGLPF
tara:strand:- start:153 stop:446 length:294 start_codon:yes stop_codon:yes gene_type:complete